MSNKEKKSGFGEKLKGIKKEKKEFPVIEYPFKIVKHVMMTEKAIRMIETQNKLVFIVDKRSRKQEIKDAIESVFQTSVASIQTVIDQKGRKKAFVRFKEPEAAGEIAMRLGII